MAHRDIAQIGIERRIFAARSGIGYDCVTHHSKHPCRPLKVCALRPGTNATRAPRVAEAGKWLRTHGLHQRDRLILALLLTGSGKTAPGPWRVLFPHVRERTSLPGRPLMSAPRRFTTSHRRIRINGDMK